jgi:hypothetical protein
MHLNGHMLTHCSRYIRTNRKMSLMVLPFRIGKNLDMTHLLHSYIPALTMLQIGTVMMLIVVSVLFTSIVNNGNTGMRNNIQTHGTTANTNITALTP